MDILQGIDCQMIHNEMLLYSATAQILEVL